EQRRAKGAGETTEPSDGELLREEMNSVGRTGKLGEQIRCVVSVSMLTEGWDANTVTHILGVRAFGTQLLCEQVVGRGLRRLSYDLNEEEKFEVEYAQVMGIPFAFTGPAIASPPTKPKTATHVHAVRERAELEIIFPRVAGFRVDMPDEKLSATFTEDSRFVLDPTIVGPCEVLMQGIVGEAITLTPAVLAAYRPSEISFNLAKHLLYRRFRDEDGFPRQHLFPQIQRICRRWLDEGWLELRGGVQLGAVLYLGIADTIAEIIANAIIRSAGDDRQPRAVLDSYEPQGSTTSVNFQTTKAVWKTDARRSHISHVTLDSEWEGELARVLEAHPKVLSYAKNQGMQFEVPYRIGRSVRRYIPDFLVRLDVGGGEVITLVLETKGFRGLDAQLKADTMHTLWVPGVNAIGTFGKWTFAEFREVFAIQEEFGRLVETLTNKEVA
ncbi:MAG: restriction endonuclease, partial [Proteobacteria bacterium]|nr:restriction endonuclease [Pseudomonadota bacterium]